MQEKNNTVTKHIILLSLAALVLVAFWFRHGNLMGGGEIGLQFYNPAAMWSISGWAWGSAIVGSPTDLTVAGAPFYGLFMLLQGTGIPGYLSQAAFFFVSVSLAMVSMYFLTRELFPEANPSVYLISSVFYFVNPYALVNVWNRFLQNPILFYAFLPLGLWLFIRGLKRRKYVYAVLNMFLTGIFSIAFAGPSQTLIFLALLFIIGLFYYFFLERKSFVFYYFLLSCLLWFVFNFFWVSQELYFRFSPSYSTAANLFFTESGNLQTFSILSNALGKISSLLLFQHTLVFTQSVDLPFKWPLLFVNPIVKVFEWIVILGVLFVSIKRKGNAWVTFLLALFFFGIFVSKGNSAPFGEIFDFLFRKFSILSFFRNPFEKLGFLLPLSFAPLLGLSYQIICEALKKKSKRLVLNLGTIIYLVIFLGFPFWTGLIFTSGNPPANNLNVGYEVEVPQYYKDADSFLANQPGIFRFITFPLGGEGIFNNWTKGYTGVEQSGILFSTPSISFDTTIPYVHGFAGNLERLFLQNNDFYKIAKLFNVDYLLFRPDFDFKLSGMRDPATISAVFTKRINDLESNLTFVKDFGPLKLFKYSDMVTLPKIYSPNQLIVNDSQAYIEDVLFASDSATPAVYSANLITNPSITADSSVTAVHSISLFSIPGSSYPSYSADSYIFPHIRWLPSSKFYPAVLLKERLQGLGKVRLEDRANWDMALLGKRLLEAKMSLDAGDVIGAKKAILLYESSVPGFLGRINTLNSFDKMPDERVWHEGELFNAFSSHMYLFNQFEKSPINNDGSISTLRRHLQEILSQAKIIPIFPALSSVNFSINNRNVYQLKVPSPGEYEILIPKTKFFPDKFSWGKSIYVQIDNRIERGEVTMGDRFVSIGKFFFESGIHEVGVNENSDSNLAVEPRNFEIETTNAVKEVNVPIVDLDPFSRYDISFDYWIEEGDGLKFVVRQNTDPLSTIRRPDFTYNTLKVFVPDYYYGYINYATTFKPMPFTDGANLSFSIKPWSNCRQVNYSHPNKCDDPGLDALYQRPTKVFVKNIKITPLLPEQIELVRTDGGVLKSPTTVLFKELNQTLYDVEIKGAQKSFLLVFSELFDNGWKAYLVDNQSQITQLPFGQSWRFNQINDIDHFLINGYANSWWVEKTGDFHIVLEYSPQRWLYIAYAVSSISAILVIIYFVLRLMRLLFNK